MEHLDSDKTEHQIKGKLPKLCNEWSIRSRRNDIEVVQVFDVVLVKFSGDHFEDGALGEVVDALGGNTKAIVAEVKLEKAIEEPQSQDDYEAGTAAPESSAPNYDEYYDDYPNMGGQDPEPINTDLAERYQITKESWPQYRLFGRKFKNGPLTFEAPDNENQPTSEDFKKFLKSNGVYIGLIGCLKEMDELATIFRDPAADKTRIVESAKERMEKYSEDVEKSAAKIYVTYMQKIIEKGESFITSESERLKRLLDGEMSDAKRTEVTKRANVIDSFNLEKRKDEL